MVSTNEQMPDCDTVVSAIEYWSQQQKDATAVDFHSRAAKERRSLSFAGLSGSAKAVAQKLNKAVNHGDRVLILLPSNLDFIVALLGCMYRGAIGVPINLPGTARVARVLNRLQKITADCQPKAIVTSKSVMDDSGPPVRDFAASIDAEIVLINGERVSDLALPLPSSEDIAFLQYTSGSTGNPKGVVNVHDPLMRNLGFIKGLFPKNRKPVVASWLPLYHDMGLIMGVLAPLAAGGRAVIMSPGAFASDPLKWLELASQEQACMLPCPSFAMDICVEHYDETRCRDLDLNGVDSFIPAAEPVLPRQIRTFHETFARHGLKWTAIRPGFGLAEASLVVTVTFGNVGPRLISVDRRALEKGRIRNVISGSSASQEYVSNGAETHGQQVCIIDPDTEKPVEDDAVGEVWVSGPEIARGYWNKPEVSDLIFKARVSGSESDERYLRTGDLGFKQDGHLYITGRLKDVLILQGQCHYPNDLEAAVTGIHPCIVAGAAAAFSVETEKGTEGAVFVQEARRDQQFDAREIIDAIRETIARNHGIALVDVVLIRKGTLKRTTSGKVRRGEMRRSYLADELIILDRSDRAPKPGAIEGDLSGQRNRLIEEISSALAGALGYKSERLIGANRSLFSLGLDSLAATQAVAELERRLEAKLPQGLIFEYPTINALADWLVQYNRGQIEQNQHSLEQTPAKSGSEPIAIIGLSCLFPGGGEDFAEPAKFWQWLIGGGNAVTPLSLKRFANESEIPGLGACLESVDGFDASFFGIGAREAINTDPQQRLLMEAVWRGLEDAGIPPSKVKGSDTGVFIGIGTGDYGHIPFATGDRTHFDPYYGTGNAFAAAAGRLSFFFDWNGPSMAVDTACSSSHAAVHYACQSLRMKECGVAIAGGVKLQMLTEIDLVLSRAGMLAQDGRCKTFDTAADGYVRGEGLGVLVLKPLSDALRDGDPIRAVIRESVLAQDGASASLSAPSSTAQIRMTKRALSRAGWSADDVDYLELHGTGTKLGDPIEFEAVREVFSGRAENMPLLMGSVKTNIGHLEAAAGIAGLIKTVLALQNATIPPHLHLKDSNPEIDLDAVPATLPNSVIDWPQRQAPRRAAVTSFGFAGTIGQILLEQAPEPTNRLSSNEAKGHLVTISARSQEACETLRQNYIAQLSSPAAEVAAMVNGAALHKEHFDDYRLAAAGLDGPSLADALTAAKIASKTDRPANAVFLFTGQGSQHVGMGKGLYENEPLFRAALDDADRTLAKHLNASIIALMFAEGDNRLAKTRWAQPAIFAIEYALACMWRGFGVEPVAMVGHSIGEFAAFVHAGTLDLESASALIAKRGRMMQSLREPGAMLAVRLREEEALREADLLGLSVAAVNTSQDVVLSGSVAAVDMAELQFANDGISAQRLNVSHAFHSSLMDPMLDEFGRFAAGFSTQAPSLPIVSTVRGEVLKEAPDEQYWQHHARQTVRFSSAIEKVAHSGYDTFIEIGPKPILTRLTQRQVAEFGHSGHFLPSTDVGDAHALVLRQSLAKLYMRGFEFNKQALFRGKAALPSALPVYPFTHKSYWLEYTAGQTKSHNLPSPSAATNCGILPLYNVCWEEIVLPSVNESVQNITLVARADDLSNAIGKAAGAADIHIEQDADVALLQKSDLYVWLGGVEFGAAADSASIWPFVSFCQKAQATQRAVRILVPTVGAQSDGSTENPLQAGIWGASRSIAIECPDIEIMLADISPDCDMPEVIGELLACSSALFTQEDMVHRDAKGWYSPRVSSQSISRAADAVPTEEAVASDGIHLVCGGAGALGGYVADWLIERGAKHLVLTGRGAPGSRIRALEKQGRIAGVEVRYKQVDIGDRRAMARLFSEFDSEGLPLRGIFHCAGIGVFHTLNEITQEAFDSVTQSKLNGAWILHELTKERSDLENFVLFSSISGIWGSRLQIHYGAANAYQDALVRMRRSQSLPATAIAWGPWGGEGGLSDVEDDLLDFLRRAKIAKFDPQIGIATLDRLVQAGSGNWIAVDVDWRVFAPLYRAFGRSDLLEKVAPKAIELESAERPDWYKLDKEARLAIISSFVNDRLQTVLKVDAVDIESDSDLIGLGLDSILVMDFARLVTRDLGLNCPLRSIFENATPEKLIQFLLLQSGEAVEQPIPEDEKVSIVADFNQRHEPFPLTELQHAYWVGRSPAHILGNIACHSYHETEASQRFDLQRLQWSWRQIVDRHDAMRLVIDDDGRQRVLKDVDDYQFVLIDLTDASQEVVDQTLAELRQTMSHQVHDPSQWPMFDIRVSRLPNGCDRLHISIDMLINDAMSSQIMWQEWQQLYDGGDEVLAEFQPFEISFRDYVLSKTSRSQARQAKYEQDKVYWTEQMHSLPPGPQLPLAVSPERIKEPRFTRYLGVLDRDRWHTLQQAAREVGVTPAGALVGLFGEVLAAWSDQPQFSLNLTIFDRLAMHSDVPRLVGDFTCLTLLALDHSEEQSVRDRLNGVQAKMFEALEHRSYSAVDVLRELNRGEGGQQFTAPVVFTSQLGMADPTKSASTQQTFGRLVYGITQTPQVWLDHQAAEEDGALVFNWDVVDGLFPDGLVEAMFEAYQLLLTGLADDISRWDRPVGDLRPAHQIQVRTSVNATARDLPLHTLDRLFFDTAALKPDNIALIAGDRQWRYVDLQNWVGRLSGLLLDVGLKPGDRVAVSMQKGPEQAAACLAILSQGGVYVPIDPSMPAPRFAKIMQSSNIEILLSQRQIIDQLPSFAGKIIAADDDACGNMPPVCTMQDRQISDHAYVIYTSGSTGTPKGVLIDHRGAANTVLDINERFGVGETDRVFGFSSLGFDLSVYDLFGSFAAGAALVLPDPASIHDTEHWADLIKKHHITVWNSVPAVCDLLVGEPTAELNPLRLVLLSGDWVPLKLPHRLRERSSDVRVVAMGGATEASIWSNWFDVKDVDPAWRSIPYGYPLSNQSYRILDRRLTDRPDWVIGDLYIGGCGLALGYENDEERTAAAFIKHPDGQRLYRTGDLARYWPDGTIEFLGRRDTQVKIAGHRIELEEIEASLTAHSDVREAVVDIVDDNNTRRLMGWLLLEKEKTEFHVRQSSRTFQLDIVSKAMAKVAQGLFDLPDAEPGVSEAFEQWQQDLAARSIQDILAQTGLIDGNFSQFSILQFLQILNATAEFEPLVKRWLTILEDAGVVEKDVDHWRFRGHSLQWKELESQFAKFGLPVELATGIQRILPQLLDVVRGVTDPLEVFYRAGLDLSPDILARFHPHAIRAHNNIGRLLNIAASKLDRPLRVLEVGARTGTASVDWAQSTDTDLCEIVISDPSSTLLEEAEAKLTPILQAEFKVFDATATASSDIGVFDVVLAFNALHRTTNVDHLLSNIRGLLRPGGQLLATELTRNGPMIDLTAGLIERDFRDLDDLRADTRRPLLDGKSWCACLTAAGFQRPRAIRTDGSDELIVLMAENESEVFSFQPGEVSSYLAGQLPDYMVPKQFMTLDALPLSANGKVDRKKLPRPQRPVTSAKAVSAPETEVERDLAAIWGELLSVESMARDANFFNLGGDSLIAVRMAERIRTMFGCKVSLREIFAAEDLAQLAAKIDRYRDQVGPSDETVEPLIVAAATRHEPFALTEVQQAYFVGRQSVFPLGGVSTHLFTEIDVTQHSIRDLEWAWNALIHRHDMLRAIINRDGFQQILDEVPVFSIMTSDLPAGDERSLQHWLHMQRESMSHRVYDTTQWPLFDIRAANLKDSVRLLVSVDNLICDGRSMTMLLSEWAALARDRNAQLPALELSFRDVVLHWEQETQSDAFQTSLAYWIDRLPHLPAGPSLPVINDPAKLTPPTFKRLEATLDLIAWRAFRDHAARLNLSPNAALMTAYAASLTAAGGGEFFSLNLTLFRRDPIHPQIDLVVGDFTSLLLVPFNGRNAESIKDAAVNLQYQLLDDLEHARVSAIRVMREAALQNNDAQALSVPVVFTSGIGVDNTASDGSTSDWLGQFTGGITQTPQVWIDHQAVEREGVLVFNWDYVEGLFDQAWIEQTFDTYCTLVKRMAEDINNWNDALPRPFKEGATPAVQVSDVPALTLQNLADSDPRIEATISDMLAAELGCDSVDPERNFFELGATSLSLLRLHQKLKRQVAREFPVIAMFAHPTVRDLSGFLSANQDQQETQQRTPKSRLAAREANKNRRRRLALN